MDWVTRMNGAIAYVELHLADNPFPWEGAARAAQCSLYLLQRMFAAIAGYPLGEYIRRRRLTRAAFSLKKPGVRVLDAALSWGYESPEAFARAFQAFHGIPPSLARRQGSTCKSFARLSFHLKLEGGNDMQYRIEHKEPFRMYGIEGIFDITDGENLRAIPAFWEKLLATGDLQGLARSTGLPKGVPGRQSVHALCDYRPMAAPNFPYLVGAFASPESRMGSYVQVDVPASTWAVFKNAPHAIGDTSDALQALIDAVYAQWLPNSNYKKLDGYEVECYYMDDEGRYYEEAWIRVEEQG